MPSKTDQRKTVREFFDVASQNETSRAKHGPFRVTFLLSQNFTLLAFTGALEALRLTNQLSGNEYFSWTTVSCDGSPVRCSANIDLVVTGSLSDERSCDLLIVCGGHDAEKYYSKLIERPLRYRVRHGMPVIAVCTGAYILARVGILTSGRCTIHWDHANLLCEKYPDLTVTNSLYEINAPGIATCSGGIAAIDLLLELIGIVAGKRIAIGVAEKMIYRVGRPADSSQRFALAALNLSRDLLLTKAVQIMDDHVHERLSVSQIANECGTSRRQLERKFKVLMRTTPHKYFLERRLKEARSMLLDTNLGWKEVADILSFPNVRSLREKLHCCSPALFHEGED